MVIPAVAVLDLLVVGVAWSARWSWPAQLAVVVTALVVGALLVVAWLGDRQIVGRSLLAVLVVGLVALELGSYANHTRARRSDSPTTAAYLRYLHTHVGDGRVLDVGPASMLGDWGAALGIREIGTLDIMQIPWYRTFYLRYVGGSDSDKFLRLPRDATTRSRRGSDRARPALGPRTSWSTTTPPGPSTTWPPATRWPIGIRPPMSACSPTPGPGAAPS